MFEENMKAASVAEYKLSDKHLMSSVIGFWKEYFQNPIETKTNNEYSSFESIYSDCDNPDGDRNYLSGSKKKSSGCYSENGYENYECVPEWDTYREAYPEQELPEIDPAELWAFWHEKEESQ
jgi:hypothetical protein